MKYRYIVSLAALACSVVMTAAPAPEFVVVANPSVGSQEFSLEDVKNVFLLTKTSLKNGTHVEPVLEKSGAAHERFVKDLLGKTDTTLQNYYRSLAFTGKGAVPKAVASDADVLAYVAKTKGAIGYVSAGADTSGVKVIEAK